MELLAHVTQNESWLLAGIYLAGVASGAGGYWLLSFVRLRRRS